MRIQKEEAIRKLQLMQKNIYVDLQEVCNQYEIPFFVSGGTAIGTIRHHGFIPWDDDIDVCLLREDYNKLVRIIRTKMSEKYVIYDNKSDDGYVLVSAKLCLKDTKIQEGADTDSAFPTGIFVDLFPYDRTTFDEKKRKRQIRDTWFWARCCVMSVYKHPRFPKGLTGMKLSLAKVACFLIHYLFVLLRLDKQFFYRRYLRAALRYKDCSDGLYTDFSYREPEKVMCTENMIFPLRQMPFEDITVQMLNKADDYLRSQYGDYMRIPPEEERITHNPIFIDFGDGTYYKQE